MKIECVLKREGGTKIEMDGVEYHFKPQADGAHVADIADRKHIGKLLTIPEGYLIYDAEQVAKPAPAADDSDDDQGNAAPASTEAAASAPQEPATEKTEGDDKAGGLADLKAKFEAKFGRKPHHKWNAERIAAELAEAE